MAALLLIPAAALAFAALGGAISSVRAARARRVVELPRHLFWSLTTAAGSTALYLMATGRPA